LRTLRDRYTGDEMIILVLVGSIFVSIYATLAALILMLGYLIRKNRIRRLIEYAPGVGYLAAFCALTLIVSVLNDNRQGILMALALAVFFLAAIFMRQVMTRSLFETIIDVSLAASLFSFLVMVIQRFTLTDLEDPRVVSTFGNANYFAAITEILILLCLYRLLGNKTGSRIFPSIVLACNLAGLYISDCRTAFAACGLSILVLLLLNQRYRALGLVVALDILLILAVSRIPDLLPRTSAVSVDLVLRVRIWQAAIRGILKHPVFGQGTGTYLLCYARQGGPGADHAHNLILEPLLNYGLAGIALLLPYSVTAFKSICRLMLSIRNHQTGYLVVSVLCCLVIHGIMDIPFFGAQTGLLLLTIISAAGIAEQGRLAAKQVPDWLSLPEQPALLEAKRAATKHRLL